MPESPSVANAMLVPVQALMEFMLALTGHLYDRQQIAPNEIIKLLEKRLSEIPDSTEKPYLSALLLAQIDWLRRIGTGERAIPPKIN